jgi:hypothetical protein
MHSMLLHIQACHWSLGFAKPMPMEQGCLHSMSTQLLVIASEYETLTAVD